MNNKNGKIIVTGIIAVIGAVLSGIWNRFKGREEGHKEGVEDANKRNEEALDEIIRKNSSQ